MEGDVLLEARDVHKVYPVGGGVHALRRVSLSVRRGECLLISGPSGCGKSTLLHVLGGLDRPTRGEVWLEGQPYGRLSEQGLARLRRQRIGFVFQFFNLLQDLTAVENVALPLRLAGRDARAAAERARALLAAVGLEHRAGHYPGELSGGEQQRVAIARAVANEPALILADEPTGNLDQASAAEVVRLFAGLRRRGQTVVLVSHDPGMRALADRVVRMRDGQIEAVEPGEAGGPWTSRGAH